MKKLLFLLTSFCLFTTSFAAFEIKPSAKKATDIFLPIGPNGQKISLMQLSVINLKDFESLAHRHLKFFDRIAFRGAQRKLKNAINPGGTINNKQLLKLTNTKNNHPISFNVGWFFIGWFLSILGVVLAYTIEADISIKKNRIKWAWIGFGVVTLLYLLLLLAYTLK